MSPAGAPARTIDEAPAATADLGALTGGLGREALRLSVMTPIRAISRRIFMRNPG